MKVFYHPGEQEYRPRQSLFNGKLTPYPDVPERTGSILRALESRGGCEFLAPPPLDEALAAQVHGPDYLEALETLCGRLGAEEEFFPFLARPSPLLLQSAYPRVRMGYFAVDGSTPLLRNSHATALLGAATAMAGAEALLAGEPLVYSLARPPGHHAGREFYAGYCLLNNAALAAARLTRSGRVAVLDVDFHHGNGTQDIFYDREEVLYVSLHCRPQEAYPYIAGEKDETGSGKGAGCNVNLPLPAGTDWPRYRPALEAALEKIAAFGPDSVVVSLGFDTVAGDPMGSFRLRVEEFEEMGRLIAGLGMPLLVVQEGGYLVSALGQCALTFFAGLGAPGGKPCA